MSDDQMPCPFCGSTDISEGEVLTTWGAGGTSTQSMCRGCGALGPEAPLKEGEVDYGSVKATEAWNRRAPVTVERWILDLYGWLDSVCPSGYADEAFRVAPEAVREAINSDSNAPSDFLGIDDLPAPTTGSAGRTEG